MPVSSAPGKVYLFGEHAVVYGEPAIPCAIDRRARVRVRRREDDRTRITAPDLGLQGLTVEYGDGLESDVELEPPATAIGQLFGYVDMALDVARSIAEVPTHGFDVRIESDLPLGGGLGSSAAVTVATIDAATRALDVPLSPPEVADHGYNTEYTVQDGNASRADTFCSAIGGAVRVEGDDCRSVASAPLSFAVGFDGGAGDTAALVAGVRDLKETYDFAAATVSAIGGLVRAGQMALAEGDRAELGRLMNVNHGLLHALGVSAGSLDQMVWAARSAGANGAKLTGAGGGGCIVTLGAADAVTTALQACQSCEEAFRTSLDTDGIRAEGSL